MGAAIVGVENPALHFLLKKFFIENELIDDPKNVNENKKFYAIVSVLKSSHSNASVTVQVSRGLTITSFKSDSLRKLSHFHSRF